MMSKLRAFDKEDLKMYPVIASDEQYYDEFSVIPHHYISVRFANNTPLKIWEPVEKFIIMPASGLLDKKDQEIFSGDIIRLDEEWASLHKPSRLNCFVGLKMGAFMYGQSDIMPLSVDRMLWMVAKNDEYSMTASCEIIGNFFENPRLLELLPELTLKDIVNADRYVKHQLKADVLKYLSEWIPPE